ncbi:armadillo-type protein [Chytridium lagenaria]|nr:armadillo-type protein [Chytridium lagenaria]
MDASTLKLVEEGNDCQKLYQPKSLEDKGHAEQTLAYHFPTFSESTFGLVSNASPTVPMTPLDSISNCQYVLERSSSPYALTFATAQLKTLSISHFSLLSLEHKLELRNFLLRLLGHRTTLQPFITSGIATLFSIITKLGWHDADEFQSVLSDLGPFLQASINHRLIAIHLLGCLVNEMNSPSSSQKSLVRHRKTAVNFRDTQLLQVFQLSLAMLRELTSKRIPFDDASQEDKLVEYDVQLIKSCLSFDFIGTNPDEASEDVGSISVPASWKTVMADLSTLQGLFDAYNVFRNPNVTSQIMECLSLVISCRRSLFSEEEKNKLLAWILEAITQILRNPRSLDHQLNSHQFSRMLVRLRTVHQVKDIIEKPQFNDWIELITQFTVKSFEQSNWSIFEVTYLLTFWSKMVTNIESPPRQVAYDRLEDLSAQVAKAFVSSRVKAVDEDIKYTEELFDDEANLTNILELIAPTIRLRVKYDETRLGTDYQALIKYAINAGFSNAVKERFENIHAKFTWCVYFIGCSIGQRPFQSSHTGIYNFARPCILIKQLMNINSGFMAQLRQDGASLNMNLDLAFLYFFLHFTKSYFKFESNQGTKVYHRLAEVFALNDQYMVLNVVMQKICNNLKYCLEQESVVVRTLQLFSDLINGHTAIRHLRKTETAQMLLQYHTAEYFPFLDVPSNARRRTTYYSVLCRLLYAAEDSFESEAYDFLNPLRIKLEELSQITDVNIFRESRVRTVIDGLFRDLRGIVAAFEHNNPKKAFGLFFDWFFPFMPVLLRALEANYDNSTSISILRFFVEFVHNKNTRCQFDVSSPNGILLFRETSKVVAIYGRLALRKSTDDAKKWAEKYKGYMLIFNILRNALCGKYVNFGVFELYDDPALVNALAIYYEIAISIPLPDLMVCLKACSAYFQLLEGFCNDQLFLQKDIDSSVLSYILRSLGEGLKSQETIISTAASNAVDAISTFIFQNTFGAKRVSNTLVQRVGEFPQILQYLVSCLLDVVIFEDPTNAWCLSRPLLPLILLNKEFFEFYTTKIIQNQLPERQGLLGKAFQALMEGIQFNLITKNRDLFTQQVLQFKVIYSTLFSMLTFPTARY